LSWVRGQGARAEPLARADTAAPTRWRSLGVEGIQIPEPSKTIKLKLAVEFAALVSASLARGNKITAPDGAIVIPDGNAITSELGIPAGKSRYAARAYRNSFEISLETPSQVCLAVFMIPK